MTRNTQRNVIRQNSTIFPINICPLDKPWSFVKFSAITTCIRGSKVSSYPIMQSTVTYFLTLPRMMFGTLEKNLGVFLFTSKSTFQSSLDKLLISYQRITFTGTKVSVGNFRRRFINNLSTFKTSYFNHSIKYRPLFGEKQV